MYTWNPWHGCHKISAGCQNCYVYRRDGLYGKDSTIVSKNADFNLPIKKKRDKSYKIPLYESVFTCGTSDFFIEQADEWRKQAWEFIKIRSDLNFLIVTKRIDRFKISLPEDWKDGYQNVSIASTSENQDRANYRLPIFMDLPIKHKIIAAEPLLENIELGPYLSSGQIEAVIVGGESGQEGRVCDFDWILNIRRQCIEYNVAFNFKQTGTHFIMNGKHYTIERKLQHSQAKKANIDLY